jgi:hypothetical protein
MNDENNRQIETNRPTNWRNTMMTIADLASRAPSIADLASRAPSAYDLLYRLGLERRRSRAMRAASRAGWIGVGMALGSGLAMLFTPRSGPEVRERLGEQAKRARDYVAPPEDEAHDLRGRSPAPSSASSTSSPRAPRRP